MVGLNVWGLAQSKAWQQNHKRRRTRQLSVNQVWLESVHNAEGSTREAHTPFRKVTLADTRLFLLNKYHSSNKSKSICKMNMQNENGKFGIQTAQRRTDYTAVIGVNWSKIPGRWVGANRTWLSEVKIEREGRLAWTRPYVHTPLFHHCHFNIFLIATLLLGRHKNSS